MIKRYEHINKKFQELFEKANETAEKSDKLVFFKYSSETKLSAEIANKLIYKWPNKIIAVAYVHEERANISFRGRRVRMLVEKALEKVEGRGGGHEMASAASIKTEDLEKFISEIRKQL